MANFDQKSTISYGTPCTDLLGFRPLSYGKFYPIWRIFSISGLTQIKLSLTQLKANGKYVNMRNGNKTTFSEYIFVPYRLI